MKPKSLYRGSEKIREFIGFFEFNQLGVRLGMMEQDMSKQLFFFHRIEIFNTKRILT